MAAVAISASFTVQAGGLKPHSQESVTVSCSIVDTALSAIGSLFSTPRPATPPPIGPFEARMIGLIESQQFDQITNDELAAIEQSGSVAIYKALGAALGVLIKRDFDENVRDRKLDQCLALFPKDFKPEHAYQFSDLGFIETLCKAWETHKQVVVSRQFDAFMKMYQSATVAKPKASAARKRVVTHSKPQPAAGCCSNKASKKDD